jgi:flagellar hook protein FlgE
MDSGVSALSHLQDSLNVTANNIANVETTGFKSGSVSFSDTFSQTMGGASYSGSKQIGTGVGTAAIKNLFTQGSVSNTGNANDMAITTPNGFFLVKDPTTGNTFATRDGSFSVDPAGFLITSSGMRVQGYNDGPTLSTVGDILIDTAGSTSTAALKSYSFNNTGTLTVLQADGTSFSRGQILLQNFTSPEQLLKVGDNLYSGLTAAGPLAAPVAPGSKGLGLLQTGALEMSNVDLAKELTTLITTQRAYEANSKVVTTSDEILQSLVNLKH